MKTWKLVSGILSIVFCFATLFQSCAAGIYNTLLDTGDIGGSVGVLVTILLLAGGIVSIATRKSCGNGGDVAIIVLFGIAALSGYVSASVYKDLVIWATWCLICAVLAVVSIVKRSNIKKTTGKNIDESQQTTTPQVSTGHVYKSDVDATATHSIDFSFSSFVVGLIVSVAGLVFLFFSWWGLAAVAVGLATLIFAYFQQ